MTNRMSRPLDIPQHTAHKADNSQKSRFNPYLKVEIVRMDKRGITVVQIKIPNIVLRSSSAQSCSCDRRFLNHFHRSLIERNPAGRGGIRRIGNGQNPVPNGIRQKWYRQTAQHHKSRDQPRLPQNTITTMAQAIPTQLARE